VDKRNLKGKAPILLLEYLESITEKACLCCAGPKVKRKILKTHYPQHAIETNYTKNFNSELRNNKFMIEMQKKQRNAPFNLEKLHKTLWKHEFDGSST
jgi:hypothetical protein